jgi:hypothetical protein
LSTLARRIALTIILCSAYTALFGQGSQLPKYTVATLPAATPGTTRQVQVIDGTTTTDCTVGGASGTSAHNVDCIPFYNGSAWVWKAANQSSTAGISLTTTGTSGASTLIGTVLNIPQYQGQISLTTTGTSGAASLIGNTLNVPQYAVGTTTNALTMNNSGSGDASGSTFNGSAAKTLSYNSIGAQQALSLTTTGSSGAATLVSGTLNIPQYSSSSPTRTCNGNGCYRVFADGTIEAWGSVTVSFSSSSLGTGTIVFPNTGGQAFASAPSLVTTPAASPSGSNDAVTSYVTGLSTSGATSVVRCAVNIGGSGCSSSMTTTVPVSWYAIGNQ